MYKRQPDYLILKIINPKTQEETKREPISITGEDSYTFTNLAKYDENGDEIAYTADEQEVSSGDLFNYGKEVRRSAEGTPVRYGAGRPGGTGIAEIHPGLCPGLLPLPDGGSRRG